MISLLEMLLKVRQRIDKPQKWCSYWWESEDGKRLGIDGAIWWASDGNKELQDRAFHALANYSGINPLWKDYERVTYLTTHKDVMTMLDKAIEVERAMGE